MRTAIGDDGLTLEEIANLAPRRYILRLDSESKRGEFIMTNSLSRLIELARAVSVDKNQREEQRRSFVYGNTAIENDDITREMVNERAVAVPVVDD